MKKFGFADVYDSIKEKCNQLASTFRLDFDKKLIAACQDANLRDIVGNSMDGFRFRGIVALKLYFQKGYAEIKSSTYMKKISSLDPVYISKELKKEIDRLFERPFDAMIFLKSLFNAYQHLFTETQKRVLLKNIHKQLWLEKQKDDFFEMSDPRKMTQYLLDEFSVDLGKLLTSKIDTLDNGYKCNIHLGAGGINIYKPGGDFNSYKYLEFERRAENG
jgi:hypothetical protein